MKQNNSERMRFRAVRFAAMAGMVGIAIFAAGCAYRAPTIAHIHLGHAITGASDTPDNVGYLVYAEQQAQAALTKADTALAAAASVDTVKADVKAVNEITNTAAKYPLVATVREVASHIRFAAESNDASANLKTGYPHIEEIVDGVIVRGELINRYAGDVDAASSADEVKLLGAEIRKLAYANVNGEDTDGDGKIGTTNREYGVMQIRRELDALIAREDPPYTTVDRWYLFNLIRLPTGEWIFRRSGGDKSKGY